MYAHSLGWLEVLDACKHEPDRQFFMHKSYQFLLNCDGAQVYHSAAKCEHECTPRAVSLNRAITPNSGQNDQLSYSPPICFKH